ncbi:DNA mismatch repair protein MutS, partial [bacterium]
MIPQTPMLKQYFAIRAENPGVLLAMRVGDFYEFYGPDAEAAAGALEITLTGREDGTNGRVAMAGVPFHSVEKYLARLVGKGHRVALCEQMEDPRAAKGLVKRGVARILTPGTVVEDAMLASDRPSLLAALARVDATFGLATLDSSTGEFVATEIGGEGANERVIQELARLRPAELLVGPGCEEFGLLAREGLGSSLADATAPRVDAAERALLRRFEVSTLAGFGLEGRSSAIVAAAMALTYAESAHPSLDHVLS